MSSMLQALKRFDAFGALLLLAFASLAIAAGSAALNYGWFRSPWEFAVWPVVCTAFLVVGLPRQSVKEQGIASSKWANRADIERANIDQKTPCAALKTEAGRTEAGKEGVYLGYFFDKLDPIIFRYKEGKHILSFGTPGANKSTGLVVPNLQHLPRSVIVIDVKGELAAITAKTREQMGRVMILNPFGLLVKNLPHLKSVRWNPILQLNPKSHDFESDAYCIASALIDKSGGGGTGNSKFFENSAENLAAALIMWERYIAKDKASLRNLRAEVSAPNEYDERKQLKGGFLYTLKLMANCEQAAIRNAGARLYARLTDPNSQATSAQDVIDTFMASTRFLDDPRIGADMREGAAINFGDLHQNITTIYLILPAHELLSQAKWLRLFVNIGLRELYKSPPVSPKLPPVLLMLDEFGNLGWLSEIENALNLSRGYRIQLWMFLQNLGQLKANYKDKWESFFTGAGAVTSFRTGDMETAEQLVKHYGNSEKTIQTESATGVSNTPHAIPLIRSEDLNRLERGRTISLIEPCGMPIQGFAPVYPATHFKDGLDPNPYYHG